MVSLQAFCVDSVSFSTAESISVGDGLDGRRMVESLSAMMFLGDHFIGTEPYMEDFEKIGLDAVVGSVGNGSTLRLIPVA